MPAKTVVIGVPKFPPVPPSSFSARILTIVKIEPISGVLNRADGRPKNRILGFDLKAGAGRRAGATVGDFSPKVSAAGAAGTLAA